jgi:hypothetical protein
MPTPEQAYAQEVPTPCVEPLPAAESACDARCQAGPCCEIAEECELERHSIQYSVGDCAPDGRGGCQRSTSGSLSSCCSLDRAQGELLQIIHASRSPYRLVPCLLDSRCQSDSDAQKLAIGSQGPCCLGSSPCCAPDSPNVDCHQSRSFCLL